MKSTGKSRKSAEDTKDGTVDNMALKSRVCRLVVSVGGGGPGPCEVWHLLKPHPDKLLMWPEASARDQASGSIWQVLDEQWLTGYNVEVKENGESEEKVRSSTLKAFKCWRHQQAEDSLLVLCSFGPVHVFGSCQLSQIKLFQSQKLLLRLCCLIWTSVGTLLITTSFACKSRSRRACLRHITYEAPGSPAFLKRSVRVFVNVQMSRRIFLKCKQKANVEWREMFGQMSP